MSDVSAKTEKAQKHIAIDGSMKSLTRAVNKLESFVGVLDGKGVERPPLDVEKVSCFCEVYNTMIPGLNELVDRVNKATEELRTILHG